MNSCPDGLSSWCCPHSVLKWVTRLHVYIFHQERSKCTFFQNFIWEIEGADERIRVDLPSKNIWFFIVAISQKNIPWVALIWAQSLKITSAAFIGIWIIPKSCSRWKKYIYILSNDTLIFLSFFFFLLCLCNEGPEEQCRGSPEMKMKTRLILWICFHKYKSGTRDVPTAYIHIE